MSESGASAHTPLGEVRGNLGREFGGASVWQFPEADSAAKRPVFIHSSWRTGKTWFSFLFRHFPETTCFYEPFNESLAGLTPAEAVQRGPRSWESGHPGSAPYWRDYLPLLRKSGGVRLFRPEMSYEWFFPIGGLRGELRDAETRYLAFLARYAQRRRQIPVFSFSRSLGRIAAISKQFPGKHIVITRNLWVQWLSYLDNRQRGNPYFMRSIFWIVGNADPFMEYLHDFYFGTRPRSYDAGMAEAPQPQTDEPMASLSDSDVFSMFVATHVYLYLHARTAADLLVDSTRLAVDSNYRQSMTRELRELTGLRLSLADARERLSLASADHAINRDRIESHLRIAATMGADGQDNAESLKFTEGLLEAIYEKRSSHQYFAPLRNQLSLVARENEQLKALLDERDTAVTAAEAKAAAAETGLAGARVELAALHGEFAEAQRQSQERIAALDAVSAAAEARAAAAEAGRAEAQTEIVRLRDDIGRADMEIRQRGADEFTLRGDIGRLQRALDRAERQGSERERELEPLRLDVAVQHAALAAARHEIRGVEALLAETRKENAAQRSQLAAMAAVSPEKSGQDAAIGKLKAELAELRSDVSAAGQVGHELLAAAADVIAPEQRSEAGAMPLTLSGLRRAFKLRPMVKGDRARDAKQWRLAARHYQKALARDPNDAPCWVQLGHALKESGRLAEAETAYRRSLACAPDVADTYLQLGHVLKLQGKEQVAQAAYLRALALDPEMVGPAEELAGLGWSAAHLARLRRLLANPGIARLRALRDAADAARDRRDWPEAARLYKEYVAADPSALDIAVQQGHALKETGDLSAAAQAYYRVLEARPRDDDLHLQLGHLEKLRRDYAAGVAHYQEAAAINPHNTDARREAEALRHRVREPRSWPEAAQLSTLSGKTGPAIDVSFADRICALAAASGKIEKRPRWRGGMIGDRKLFDPNEHQIRRENGRHERQRG
jgi:Flp pilus assembly protein TadD